LEVDLVLEVVQDQDQDQAVVVDQAMGTITGITITHNIHILHTLQMFIHPTITIRRPKGTIQVGLAIQLQWLF
jgi:hypothetical protein